MNENDAADVLLLIAEGDFETATLMSMERAFSDRAFGFFVQQAAEKALKAWLLTCGFRAPFVHDLRQLISQLDEIGQDVSGFWELENLTPYAVQFRYELDVVFVCGLPRDEALGLAGKLLRHVRALRYH